MYTLVLSLGPRPNQSCLSFVQATPAAVSGSDDLLVLVVGIISGSVSCVTILTVVCLLVRRRIRTRQFTATTNRHGDENGALPTATSLTRNAGGKEVNITTSVVSKDSIANGSIIGTTSSDYFGSPVQQQQQQTGLFKNYQRPRAVRGGKSGQQGRIIPDFYQLCLWRVFSEFRMPCLVFYSNSCTRQTRIPTIPSSLTGPKIFSGPGFLSK